MSKPDARTLAADLAGLTVLRPLLSGGALMLFHRYIEALCVGDAYCAQLSYSEMFSEMLKIPRLTGEVFRDCWIYSIITGTNEFTKMAMLGGDDAVINAAMEHDLRTVQWFCRIGGKNLADIARPTKPASNAPASDAIVRMAGAAWGGAPVEQNSHKAAPQTASQNTERLTPPLWQYDRRESGFKHYYAEEAISELIDQFGTEEDWARLLRPLQKLFLQHGEIARFKYKRSYFDGGELVPVCPKAWPQWSDFVGMEGVQNAFLERAEEFLAGAGASNLLIYGEAGLGKTSLVYALAELASVRLIITSSDNWENMGAMLAAMRVQPMKFIVLIDDVKGELPDAIGAYTRFAQSENVWLVATSRDAMELRFAESISLEPPPLKAFIQRVMELARSQGIELDYDSVQDVCIDWKVDGGDLTASAALKVLSKLIDL